MKLILASNSPRRKQLLSQAGYKYTAIGATCAERSNAATPRGVCLEQAVDKALSVYAANRDCVVIGCDTVVDDNGKLLGKPLNESHARQMLGELSGKTHLVHSGVCIVYPQGIVAFTDTSAVTFRTLTSKEIDDYVATGSPLDKAGAYGVQDSGFVCNIDGSYNNVVGFPTEKIFAALDKVIVDQK